MASQISFYTKSTVQKTANVYQGSTRLRFAVCDYHKQVLQTRRCYGWAASRALYYRTSLERSSGTQHRHKTCLHTAGSHHSPYGNSNLTILPLRGLHIQAADNRLAGHFVSTDMFSHIGRPLSPRFDTYSTLLQRSMQDTSWLVVHRPGWRAFHTSSVAEGEAKSKVEETVKALQEEAKKAAKEKPLSPSPPPVDPTKMTSLSDQDMIGLPQSQASRPIPTESTSAASLDKPAAKEVKLPLRQRIVAEIKHYYHGFRLLIVDVRVCIRLLWILLFRRSLTRRERRQLVRTTADLFRLVPFAVFLIVPFMEFLLPVFLKFFPNMLPSTFKDANKEQEKLRKKLKSKLEVAKFLQDTVEEIAVQKKGAGSQSVHDFKLFLQKIRSSGEQTTNEDIMKYSKLFQDSLTLDNLGHDHLVALCRLLELQPLGSSAFLRFQLRMKLRSLEADDKLIAKEGIDSLAVWELQEACRQRGMRALGVSIPRLKNQLQQWLDLHLKENLPASLLLLSRALYLPENLSQEEQLKATISVLPEITTEEAKIKITEQSGERVDNKAKLEQVRQEEKALKMENEEKKKEQEKAKKEQELAKAKELELAKAKELELAKAKELELAKAKEQEVAKAAASTAILAESIAEARKPEPAPSPVAVPVVPPDVKPEEILVDKAKPIITKAEEEMLEKLEEISTQELEEIEEALGHVASAKMGIKLEQNQLDSLKEDISDYNTNLENLPQVVAASGGLESELAESKAAKLLRSHVNSMINQMDGIMAELLKEKESLLEDIEVVEVRMKRNPELREDEDRRQEAIQQIQEKKKYMVSINELVLAMRRLQKLPDSTKLERIIEVLDEDHDGNIDIDDALKVINVMGEENVKVKTKQMEEILALLRKEAQLKEETKAKEKTKAKEAEAIQQQVAPPVEDKVQEAQKQ